jgi:hypothetical protein
MELSSIIKVRNEYHTQTKKIISTSFLSVRTDNDCKQFLTIMSMEQESGSSVLMEMQGMPGIGSMGRPPATVGMGEHENPASNPIGEEADMLTGFIHKTISQTLKLFYSK